ncbi:cellulose biosynthesis protein BcsC [Erwinia pyrifoliae]|uniref:Cellulose synthase subunit BcsC-related outer membrane protein n=1 Tax=Erwinia pyrifoliae TaxID=79967 RepID=A0ABY5X856_ERWPY|nr:cellulose biosynthesis protein BcsC [Erwinia pyrifoliae]MCT2385510.1 cellulose synthase subunit BcsC-related outer membrane protein [Erwinia pyrifoliae]MCU8588917.1 cellulose synthase subunit BcsC-related outer membrane protein [Erwinia pyrifoliae]UWS33565.1 cellulose synthase subunit BcsC-related outer membrane protein [Erwinia pyrifoliae]
MKNKLAHVPSRTRACWRVGSSLVLSMMALPALALDNNPALKALFDQARYWHDKAHDELAYEALQKVLMVDGSNAQALYLMALWSQQRGNAGEAAIWRARLSEVSPQDPRLVDLDNARQLQTLPAAQMALARQQARSGNTYAALQTWRNTFSGNQPPASVAAEYYLTMAGDRSLLPQAVDNLRQFSASHSQDSAAKLALGKALTYQDATRREGLQLLEGLADGNADADRSLRQALLWLGPQPGDAPLYQNFQQRHPQDLAVMDYYRKNVSAAEKGQGFSALNNGDVSAAQSAFDRVLQNNPQDADALAGLGYAAQRSGDYSQAAEYLQRAAKLGGNDSQQRQQQADDARFYARLASAQQALKSGDSAQALSLSAPLTQAEGEKGLAAKLFRADALRLNHQPDQAEQTYRAVLATDAANRQAQEGLFYVLHQQNRTAEANTLLASLPASVRQAVATRPVATSDPLRREAQQRLAAGDTPRAIGILQQGLQRFPGDGWLRLDLARIYQQQGNAAAAADLMQPAFRPAAGSNEIYAAALFASENGAWSQAQSLLSRIPPRSQNTDMRTLAQRVNFNQQMAAARRYLAQDSPAAAANTLRALAVNPPDNPVDAGNLAAGLAQAGDLSTAVSVVRSNMQRGVRGNAGDYAAQLAVLDQAGLGAEAQSFINNPELQSRSSGAQLAGLRNGALINQVDELRERKQYAAAYDKLLGALQQDPQNSDLMFAMARLYQSGKMNKEAAVVYDYLMTRDTAHQQAREGGINTALALNDVAKAHALVAGLRGEPSPQRLVLMARVSEAEGDRSQALSYLRSAKGKMIGLQGSQVGRPVAIGGLALADNPFINRTTPSAAPSPSIYGNAMPWQQATDARDDRNIDGVNVTGSGSPVANTQSQTLRQIDTMMDSLQAETGTWAQAGVQIRGRDGEDGLSKLNEAKAPLTWSSAPLNDARVEFTVTPMTLSAGSASGDAYRRLGTGAAGAAVANQIQNIKNEQDYLKTLRATDSANGNTNGVDAFNAANPDVASALDNLDGINAADYNPFTHGGLSHLNAINNNTALKNYLAASSRKANVDSASSDASDSQTASGVELNLALSGDGYRIDLGSTPLGQQLSTLVGGIKWAPKLTDYLTLILTGERRAVTDSLLSYVGVKDQYSGKSWGRVTKNGGNALLSYDDGDAGFYAGAGGYSYIGENVAGNTSLMANAGAYVRPFHYRDRELKTGINISWMDFSKNLSNFSFGQGGYFSPQDYISVSLPVDFSQTYDDLSVKLGGSVGYQSYTQNSSAYFPNNDDDQSLLKEMVTAGYAKEAYFSGSSKSGIGYNLHAGADYKINKNVTLGGQLGYDTFGDYNETTAQLYLRYMLGGK